MAVVLKCSWYSMTVILIQQRVKCQCAENIWRQTNIFLIHASTLLSDTRCSLLKVELSIMIPTESLMKTTTKNKSPTAGQVTWHDHRQNTTNQLNKQSLAHWELTSCLTSSRVFFVSICLWQTELILIWRVLWVSPKGIQLQAKQIHFAVFVKTGPFLCSYRLQQQRCNIIMQIKIKNQVQSVNNRPVQWAAEWHQSYWWSLDDVFTFPYEILIRGAQIHRNVYRLHSHLFIFGFLA